MIDYPFVLFLFYSLLFYFLKVHFVYDLFQKLAKSSIHFDFLNFMVTFKKFMNLVGLSHHLIVFNYSLIMYGELRLIKLVLHINFRLLMRLLYSLS